MAIFCFANDIVYAEDEPIHFVIKTEDGLNWKLIRTNDLFEINETGEWVDNVDAIFEQEIKKCANYDYTFDFPQNLNISLKNDIDENLYTEEQNSNIVVCVSGESLIGGVTQLSLEYRLETETEFKPYETLNGTEAGVEFIFGRADIGVGQYAVRGYFKETFYFLGMNQEIVRRTSDLAHCEILVNPNPPRDEIEASQLSIQYGLKLKDIASSFNTTKGIYKVAQSELDKNAKLESVVLNASNEVQKYKFDYFSTNENYLSVKDIELSLTIKQKEIEVFIDNVQKIQGDEIVDLNNQSFIYYVRTPLVEGDNISDLGLTFYVTNSNSEEVQSIDCNISAEYRIKARCSNTNYKPISINATQNMISGGRYFVFPTGFSLDIDGAHINVTNMSGFIRIDANIEKIDDLPNLEKENLNVEYNKEDYKIKGIYALTFIDQTNLAPTTYAGEFYLIVTPEDSTKFVIYKKNGSYEILPSNSELLIQYLAGEADDCIYLILLEDIVIEESGIEWQHILMISLICVLFVTFVAVVAIYKKRRWYLV